MNCPNCVELEKKIAELKSENAKMSNALAGHVSRRSNTDMIMGAALSGGDALALAKTLAADEAKREADHAAR